MRHFIRGSEWIVGALITLAAVYLHLVYLRSAGGLWRDEASSVQIAGQPTLAEMWRMFQYESCPGLLHLVIRMWMAMGWGGSDLQLRWLGFGAGLGLLASVWWALWILRGRAPLLSLSLLALNVTVIRTGDSLRAYGLGSALIVLVVALVWRFVHSPKPVNGLLAALAAALSVQCLYQNAFLVLAACSGACAVCAWRRQWRQTLLIVGIGAVAAASLVPYIPILLRSQEWFMLCKPIGLRAAWIWRQAVLAADSPLPWFHIVWLLLILAAIGVALVSIRRDEARSSAPADRGLALYAMVTLAVSVVGFASFLKVAGLPTQPWYYLMLLAVVAVCLDAMLPAAHWRSLPVLVVLASLVTIVAYPRSLSAMKCRQTNMDLLATRLTREVAANDYILVHPWYCGVSFARYYQGAAAWTTLPSLDDYRSHRYDLVKVKLQMGNPIQPVLDRVAATLQSGGRVWLVGQIPVEGKPPPDVRPAPNNPWGWFDEPYSRIWGAQAGYFIATHATQGAVVVDASTNCISPFEDLPLVSIAGWRLPPSSAAPR